MTVCVNGTDITNYIAKQGLKWSRNDVDGPNTGRSITNAYLTRDRIATKIRLDITCRPLKASETKILLNLILPEYVIVTFDDPMEGKIVTKEMYSNNIPATFLMKKDDGTEWWSGITFPLIER